jgi:hypothetical protein
MQTLYVYGDKESLHPCYTTYTRACDLRRCGRGSAMTPRLDRFGDPIDDHDEEIFSTRTPPSQRAGRRPTVRQRCDELRRIIREARGRRDAGQ